jgi:prepilin-type processing-associated H-X9-DG protein
MKKMKTRLCFVLLILASPLAAFAQPLTDRVPAEALIYIGWQGSDNMPASFGQSHLKALLDDSNLPKFFNDMVPALVRRAGQQDQQAGEILKLVFGIYGPVWRHPTAIYSSRIDFNAPAPRAALICQAGDDADGLAEQLDKLAKIMQGADFPFPVRTFKDNGLVGLTVGYDDPKQALATEASRALSASPPFKTAIAQVQKEPIGIFYADTEGLFTMVSQGIHFFGDENAKVKWPLIRDALGLPGLKRIIATGAFDGPDWATQCFIEAPSPRSGIVKLLDGQPASDDLLKAIPATSSFAVAGSCDLAKVIAEVRTFMGNIDPNVQGMFDKGVGAAGLFLGMNIQKDFFESLGHEWALYTNPAATGNGPLGLTAINRLAKPQDAERAMGKIEMVADNMINAQLQQQKLNVGFDTTKIGNTTIHYVALPVLSPSWAIADGNLYMGLYPQMVAEAAGQVSSKGKSLLDNASFMQLRKKLGGEKATGFAYSDLPQTVNDSYQFLLMLSQAAVGAGELTGVKGPPMVLPPLSKLRKHLAPAAEFFWSDDTGWHAKSSSPFPGAQLLGSQANLLMAAPIAAAVAIPAATRREVRVQRAQVDNNLRQIGVALQMYVNDHKAYPPDFGPLLAEKKLPIDSFVSPHAGTKIPPEVRRGQADEQANWVNSRSDFVYLGAELKPGADPKSILVYERPDGRPGMNMLFADGHIEWIDVEAARQMIEKQQKAN